MLCLFVCIQYTLKRLNWSDSNLVWDLTWPKRRFMDDQNFKTNLPQILIFIKIKFKLKFNFIKIPRSFLYKIHELCIHTENVHNCNRRWAPNFIIQCTQGVGVPVLVLNSSLFYHPRSFIYVFRLYKIIKFKSLGREWFFSMNKNVDLNP